MFIDWADLPGWAKRQRVRQGECLQVPSPARPTVPPLIHGLAACGGTCHAILRVAYCEFLSNWTVTGVLVDADLARYRLAWRQVCPFAAR